MRDIERIVATLTAHHGGLAIDHVGMPAPASSEGVWYVRRAEPPGEVRLEPWTGNCPFIIMPGGARERLQVDTVPEAIAEVEKLLGLVREQDAGE